MTHEPEKSKSSFGRILLWHLGAIAVLHLGREMLAPRESIFPLLFLLAFIDFIAALVSHLGSDGENVTAYMVAAFLVFIVGFSDCASHFHLDTR